MYAHEKTFVTLGWEESCVSAFEGAFEMGQSGPAAVTQPVFKWTILFIIYLLFIICILCFLFLKSISFCLVFDQSEPTSF